MGSGEWVRMAEFRATLRDTSRVRAPLLCSTGVGESTAARSLPLAGWPTRRGTMMTGELALLRAAALDAAQPPMSRSMLSIACEHASMSLSYGSEAHAVSSEEDERPYVRTGSR